MDLTVFAFLTDAKEAISEFVNNCLLVAGGFLLGYLLGGFAGWGVGRYALRQKEPEAIKRIGRPVGGILGALIVAIIVFTGKGKPHGDGGDGKGTPNTDPNAGKGGAPKVDPDTKTDPKLPPIKLPDPKPADVTVWVTILEGGAIPAPGKFYRLEDEDTARNLEELKAALSDRKAKEKGKVVVAIRFDKNMPPGDPRLVTDVTNWANAKAGLDVILPANR